MFYIYRMWGKSASAPPRADAAAPDGDLDAACLEGWLLAAMRLLPLR